LSGLLFTILLIDRNHFTRCIFSRSGKVRRSFLWLFRGR